MLDLHLWMPAWSDVRLTILVSVDCTTLSVDCSLEQFRTNATSRYIVQPVLLLSHRWFLFVDSDGLAQFACAQFAYAHQTWDSILTGRKKLYQVLHRPTANEPLRIVQQTQGEMGLEACHAIVRRYDPRNMSD